jgi:hypothetical protein
LTGECRPGERGDKELLLRAWAKKAETATVGLSSLAGTLPLSLSHSHASLARVFLCWIERASERAERICAFGCVFWLQLLGKKAEESGHGHPTRGGCACCSLCLFGAISKSPMQRASQPVRQSASQPKPSQSSRDLISSQPLQTRFSDGIFLSSSLDPGVKKDCSNGRALRSSQPDNAKNSSRFPHSHSILNRLGRPHRAHIACLTRSHLRCTHTLPYI